MRSLATNLSVFAVLAGIATISLAASAGSAFAAAGAGGPVCVIKADGPQTYDSASAARAAHVKITHLGACTIFCQGFGSTIIQEPMCGMDPLNHAKMTYPNNCQAENARAIWVHQGPCKK
jgi:hypothetical protein